MSRYRAIFLDAGGTLIHLDRGFILNALAEEGVQKDEAAFLIADQAARERRSAALRRGEVLDDATSWRIYAVRLLGLLEATGEVAGAMCTRIRERHQAGMLWTHVEPGTLETLAQLKELGYTLGVACNADGAVESFLQLVAISSYLDFIVDAARVGVEQPDPRIFEMAMERASALTSEAVHVGDVYEMDVLGARAVGVEPVLIVTTGGVAPSDVPVIRSLPELV